MQGLAHGKPASEEKSGSPPPLNGSPAISSPAMSLGVTAALPALLWLLSSTPTPPAEAPRKEKPPAAGKGAPSSSEKQLLEELLSRGSREWHARNFEYAAELYREALRMEPDSEEARFGLGTTLIDSALSTKEALEGVILLEPLTKKRPQLVPLWLSLAHGRTMLGQRKKAIADYRHYLSLESKGAMAPIIRARLKRLEEEERHAAAPPAPKEAEPLRLTLLLWPDEVLIAGSGGRFQEKYGQLDELLRKLRGEFPEQHELAIANSGVEEARVTEVRAAVKRAGFESVREVPAAVLLEAFRGGVSGKEFSQRLQEAWTGAPANPGGGVTPSLKEVLDGIKTCHAAVNVPDDFVFPLLAQGCSEIPSCARGCAEPLAAWANRAPVGFLKDCSGFPVAPASRGGPSGTVKERTDRWFLQRLAGFVQAAQPLGELGRALAEDCQPFLSGAK